MSEDIERIKLELQQTRIAYQMACELSQFKAGFLARTAHEIRSPLSSLMGLHQLILSDLCESPEEEREFIAQAYQAAQKLIKIIDDIVTVSKLEYGRLSLNYESVCLTQVIRDLQQLVYLPAGNRNFRLEISNLDENIQVIADGTRLLQALLILVETAIRWMKEGSIKIAIAQFPESNQGIIALDTQCYPSLWREDPHRLLQIPELTPEAIKTFSQTLEASAGMKFLLAQNLIEMMGGKLEIIDTSPEDQPQSSTRLQCSLPLMTDDR